MINVKSIVILPALLLAVACSQKTEPVSPTKVNVFVDTYCSTKAGTAAQEINTLDVLVFRHDGGMLDGHKRAEGRALSLSVTSDVEMDYYVIANAPANVLDVYRNQAEFLAGLSQFDGLAGGFLFEGHGSTVFHENATVEVQLSRYACKVQLDNIRCSFLSTGMTVSEVLLTGVYLINVNGTEPWSRTATAGDLWYNKLGRDTSLPSSLQECLYVKHNTAITDADAVEVTDVLYCYPNPTDNDVTSKDTPQWSVRDTRLVIELSIDGVANYYPIEIPGMLSNRYYHIKDVDLIGQGSSSPDIDVERTGIRFAVTVNEWTDNEDTDLTMD